MLPALVHRTVLPQFPLVGLCPPRLEQLVNLSASISTTATKHLPDKAGLSFAKIPNWDGQQRRLFYPSWTQSMARKTIKLMPRAIEGEAKIGQADHVIFHTKHLTLFQAIQNHKIYGIIFIIMLGNCRSQKKA